MPKLTKKELDQRRRLRTKANRENPKKFRGYQARRQLMVMDEARELASRLNVPIERIGVAHITEPLKLSSTELEPGDTMVYLKPDYGVINMDDHKEEWWTASAV